MAVVVAAHLNGSVQDEHEATRKPIGQALTQSSFDRTTLFGWLVPYGLSGLALLAQGGMRLHYFTATSLPLHEAIRNVVNALSTP